jgi:hypothetical protein
MPAIQLSRPNLRKLAVILEIYEIDNSGKATGAQEAAWIKRSTRGLRKAAEST